MTLLMFSPVARLLLPLLVGTTLACPLFGITIGQTVWYYRHFPNDSFSFKLLVAVLLIIDTAQTISLARGTEQAYLRHNVGLTIPNSLIYDLYFSYFTVTIVQGAYTYRVWILSDKRRSLTAILVVLNIVQFASATGLTITEQRNGSVFKLHANASDALAMTEMATTAACDLVISVSLAYHLHKWRSGHLRTESIVDRLIMWVVGIGVLTSLFALMIMIAWLTMKQSILFMAFHSVMGKLYVNSLLVTLNARRGRGDDGGRTESELPLAAATRLSGCSARLKG